MLLELSIEQIALIELVRLQFSGGLNVLTGETGAGKSIILDAVQAALGGRTSVDVIRAGEERAVVEALFEVGDAADLVSTLQGLGIEVAEDGLLHVRREINRSGRSTARLNGRAVTVGMLKEATHGLVDLHGQHEHQSLLQVEKHLELLDQYGGSLLQQEGKSLELLDRYGGEPIAQLRAGLGARVGRLVEIRRELASLIGDERDRARRIDLLQFQMEELTAAKLRPGEEEELEAEGKVLAHAGKLRAAAESAYGTLYEGGARQLSVQDLLGRVRSELQDVLRHDPSLAEAVELVGSALVHVQEASHQLAAYRERVEDDPARLARVEARLDLIHSLKRKYGDSIGQMLTYQEQVRHELERLSNSEALIEQLKAEESRVGGEAEALASDLTRARRAAARELSGRVVRELVELGMANARFEVSVEIPSDASHASIGPRGWDRVEFLFSPNLGEPVKPLAKIVSGGEMSRIMLALKVILARVDGVPTLVFDEVDTGISGRAAQAVGEKLARIAGDRQVLCVTHLPQVAALADRHLLIQKEAVAGRTLTQVVALDENDRADEVARMIGGADVSAFTVEAARDMIRRANTLKQSLRASPSER